MKIIKGPVNRKPIPAWIGTPFDINLRTIGTIPHSHAGKAAPTIQLIAKANNLFLGIKRRI